MDENSGPLVSVVVPTYNNAAFIDETMQSILGQTYTNLEVIVSDHSSTDGTWERLQPYARDPRVRLLQCEPGGGAVNNWRHVTARAAGDYVKLVCGDDLIAPGSVAQQVAAMQRNADIVMVAARRDIVTATGRTLLKAWGLSGTTGIIDGHAAVRRSVRVGTNVFGEPGCVLLRRDTLAYVGGWDATYPYVLDQFTYSKVLMNGRFVGLEDSLAAFRMSNSQWSYRLARQQARQVSAMHWDLAKAFPGLLSRGDLAVGGSRAHGLGLARRFAYRALSREMSAEPPIPSRPSWVAG